MNIKKMAQEGAIICRPTKCFFVTSVITAIVHRVYFTDPHCTYLYFTDPHILIDRKCKPPLYNSAHLNYIPSAAAAIMETDCNRLDQPQTVGIHSKTRRTHVEQLRKNTSDLQVSEQSAFTKYVSEQQVSLDVSDFRNFRNLSTTETFWLIHIVHFGTAWIDRKYSLPRSQRNYFRFAVLLTLKVRGYWNTNTCRVNDQWNVWNYWISKKTNIILELDPARELIGPFLGSGYVHTTVTLNTVRWYSLSIIAILCI